MSISIVGAVLAGGGSVRMGLDKASLVLNGRHMAHWPVVALRSAGIDKVVLAGGSPSLAAELGIDFVQDSTPDSGPLGGIDAVLGQCDIAVVSPCDVPGVLSADLKAALDRLLVDDVDVVCVSGPGRREPLISAWCADRCRHKVAEELAAGRRAVHRLFDRLVVAEVRSDDDSSLHNVNRPDDIGEAERYGSGAQT